MSEQYNEKEVILQSYRQTILKYESDIQRLKKNKRILAIARLFAVLSGVLAFKLFWPSAVPVTIVSFIFIVLFIYLVIRDADQSAAIRNFGFLILVNHHEIDAIKQKLSGYDAGQHFSEPGHAYASDLDLFGESSLFQWISRCHSDQSKKLLAERLKNFLPAHEIAATQGAATELSKKQHYTQQFQASSLASPLSFGTEKKLSFWMHAPSAAYRHSFWKLFQNIYPIVPIAIFTLYISGYIPSNGLIICLLILSAFIYAMAVKIQPEFEMVSRIQPEMETMLELIALIEEEPFSMPVLQSLQKKLKPDGYPSASAAIREFNQILKRIDWRSNLVVGPVLGIFLMWDLRQMIALNQWKKKNTWQFDSWFSVIAETEWLISLASLVRNEPDWCFPEVTTPYFQFKAIEMGHPLIPPEHRIPNDFAIEGSGKLAFITGSNMAGKSTFLRALGINMVLAMTGAPVCAKKMALSPASLVSSMRVADNLAENTSTFYAELKKLKYIIEMVQQNEKVFILLDEVLRGTNSDDRHKGTRALVKQLLKGSSVTIMATHDTELAHSESADPGVSNYHFEGRLRGDELDFDYKIKKGICSSLNATALMKKIGIHFQD